MFILLNPNAGGGRALKRWKRIEREFFLRHGSAEIHIIESSTDQRVAVEQAIKSGQTDFLAAGGDGTLNALVNLLVNVCGEHRRGRVRLGTLALGSSNDFHKPLEERDTLGGIACRADFGSARPYDVGKVSYLVDGMRRTRYFIVNASAGVTAEANAFFNEPDAVLQGLRCFSTPMAILYAACRTLVNYKNRPMRLRAGNVSPCWIALTNLSILKNPHTGGRFRYDTPVREGDGRFALNLCEEFTRFEFLVLLVSLYRGHFSGMPKTRTWYASSIHLAAEEQFAVECDGEVLQTSNAEFSILHQYLQVCP